MATRRMSVSQAIVEFLAHQYTVDGDIRVRTIEGVYGIFGHGNVATYEEFAQALDFEYATVLELPLHFLVIRS